MRLFFLLIFSIGFALSSNAQEPQSFTVIEISEIPDPKTTPYEQCLVAVKCRNQAESVDQVLLFDLFKKRTFFPAATLKKGQTVSVTPIPFDKATQIRQVMQANDFFDPNLAVFYATEWAPQMKFEVEFNKKADPKSHPTAASSNTELIRRALMAHEQEVTGGLIDDFYFWVHTPEVLQTDFWKNPQISKKDAIGAREAILRFHRNLEKRGIKLIFAPVPRSTSIYPGIATNIPYDPEIDAPVNQPVLDLLAELEKEGVTCVDLTSIFLKRRYESHQNREFPVYRKNDSHWSGAGVKIAADAIVKKIVMPSKALESSSIFAEAIPADYSMPVFNGKKPRNPKSETELIFRVNNPENASLFDPFQRDAEVHLLGDSFVNYGGQGAGSYGLQPHLVQLLGKPVNVFSAGSGGPMISRSQFARAANMKTAKTVIWVFAESFLAPADVWFDVPIGDNSITNLEFALQTANTEKSIGQFSPMDGLGSGIKMKTSGSVVWDQIEIGPGQSYPKFSTFAELKTITGSKPMPAEAKFTIFADEIELASKTVTSDNKSARSPKWTTGLKNLAGQTVELELRTKLISETPEAWNLRWTLPQLKNAGFAGEFEPELVEKTVSKEKTEPNPAKPKSGRSRILYLGIPILFITGLSFGIIMGILKKKRQAP